MHFAGRRKNPMRINPSLANEMYLNYMNSDDTGADSSSSILPSGTYTKLAAAKYIKDNDKDNDGQLTADEVDISDAAYAALDNNSDGYVTRAEMQKSLSGKDDSIYAYYKNGGESSGKKDITESILEGEDTSSDSTASTYVKMAAKSYVEANDKNKDGVISFSETGLASNAFSKIDANSNGSLSLSEIQNALTNKGDSIYSYYKNGGTTKISQLTSRLLATI
jgi:Ca2+-binding EF-hand superfamily protein